MHHGFLRVRVSPSVDLAISDVSTITIRAIYALRLTTHDRIGISAADGFASLGHKHAPFLHRVWGKVQGLQSIRYEVHKHTHTHIHMPGDTSWAISLPALRTDLLAAVNSSIIDYF